MIVRDEHWYLTTRRGRAVVRWSLLRHGIRRGWPETIVRWLAWKLPHGIAYWVVVRVGVVAMGGSETPHDVTLPMMLQRWTTGASHAGD